MSTRICAYKDCNNFYFRQDNSVCHDVTLFAFPKDPKRAAQWRLLGQVHPKIGTKQLYMCSKHFDAKYLSTNKNRRILLGEAMPFSFAASKSNTILIDDEDQDQEQDQQMTPTSSTAKESYYINPRDDDDNNPTCSSTQQSYYINLDDDTLSIDKVVMVESTSTTQAIKEDPEPDLLEKIEVSIVPPTSSKRARSISPALAEEEEEELTDDHLIDAGEVSIFKFKGEQYVQMSREYYLQEKRQMLNQLLHYKRILAQINKAMMKTL
ncbi:uncharacterized protein LOC6563183 [Drosophila grimshawi]|uniref:GH18120 n=1 Tax=Drosophila grimshawi TaxID=7222 RepID=B4JGW8_DROGR|nr:uncharacterized protein LOC6563183 [Drosophila grimshawi]EDV93746.1 GH18120 [Drosophila grimshawi]